MKPILTGVPIAVLMLFILGSYPLFAQQQNSAAQSVHTKKMELKITGDIQANDLVKIDNALAGYAGKIISHEYSTAKNRLFVFISDKTDPVDILQILKRNGIKAGYRDDDNGYVTLEPDGRTTRKLYFKE
ncbi:MAG TPA: hypothetical protein VJY62_07080 [Bacteroidia bacterium]|nr:hypothetical protein [Bacteroidia bacterium]